MVQICEQSVLQLIDQLSGRFTLQCSSSDSTELLSETVLRYKQRLKKLAFQELLRKRKKKVNSTSTLLFDCVMECDRNADRKLFTTMLDDYLSQLISIQGEDAARASFEFLGFLQNTCQKSDGLTPKECMCFSVISSAAKSQLKLKRFFSGGHSGVDSVQGDDKENLKLLSATGKPTTLHRFFSDERQTAPIGTISREPLQSRKRMLMAATNPCHCEVDEGFVDDQFAGAVAEKEADIGTITRDQELLINSHQWISSWRNVNFNEPSLRKSWDQFGSLDPRSEFAFSTDGDSRVNYMECVNYCRHGNSSEYVTIPEDILVVHSLNVLVGVSSSTFVYHMTEMEFTVRSNIKAPSISPAALQSVLQDFASCGSCFERLSFFCKHASSLFVSCLASQIHKLLRIVHGFVVALFDERNQLTVFKLDQSTKRVCHLMMFLMDIVSGSFQGAEMLTYLYQKCLDSLGSQYYRLMVHLFKACCQPYMDLVQHWIYHGLPQDTSCLEEFILEPGPEFLASRNRDFWTKAVALKVSGSRSDVPLFLREHLDDVFQCGKTVMLIRACQTYHYLVSNYLQSPRLTVTFDPAEVKQVEKEVDSYTSQLQALIDAEIVVRNEQENEVANRKHRIQAEIRRAATQEFEELAKRLAEESESTRVKRARELVALKDEMEASLARKKEAVADEKRRDAEMVRLGEAKNQEELQRIRDIEQQARAELIAYYEELTADAAKREQKAIWKLKRRQLHDKRQEVMAVLELNPDAHFITLENQGNEQEPTFEITSQVENIQITETENGTTDNYSETQNLSSKIPKADQFVDNSAVIKSDVQKTTSERFSKSVNTNLPANEDGMQSDFAAKVAISDLPCSNELSEQVIQNAIVEEKAFNNALEEKRTTDLNLVEIRDQHDVKLNNDGDGERALEVGNTGGAKSKFRLRTFGLPSSVGEMDHKPLIRVGIQMNLDSKDMLSWPEDNPESLSTEERLKQPRTKVAETPLLEASSSNLNMLPVAEWEEAPQEYRKRYSEFSDEHPIADIVSRVVTGDLSSVAVTSEEAVLTQLRDLLRLDVDDSKQKKLYMLRKDDAMIPLPVLMRRILVQPLRKQLTLVNNSAVQMFLSDYNLKTHFEALRRSLLLADPEFAHGLCSKLFSFADSTELQSHGLSQSVAISLTPFLRAVNFAVEKCLWEKKDLLFERLTIRLRPSAEFLDLYHPDCFSVLLLAYRVDWPINIIISDSCLHKYLKIFHFLLALRRLANVLTGLYFHMKQTQILFDVTGSVHFAKLQYARHLMQHLSNVMSDYVQDQLLNVSHVEFERSFEQAKSVDDMHESHAEYLNAMLSRALLTPQCAKVMKLIYSMFSQIIMFQRQLSNGYWFLNSQSGLVEHSSFNQLISSFNKFSTHLKFLVKVVSSLADNGYQPHLENFLLKLNFNQFYLKITA
ncbi:gamma-tubulin complex component 6-like isoform X2 [Convolutriloba macropyga]|uniref:gamma-tubulin complex component 6-like isoform X2 n=1 Tax=Convolutriloba macropyga TaxID=536237 RepID=UPI003F51CFA5